MACRAGSAGLHLAVQGDLHGCRNLIVQRLDLFPQIAQREHVACDDIGTGDVHRRHSRLFGDLGNEGAADPVDKAVGDRSGDKLAAQTMVGDTFLVRLVKRRSGNSGSRLPPNVCRREDRNRGPRRTAKACSRKTARRSPAGSGPAELATRLGERLVIGKELDGRGSAVPDARTCGSDRPWFSRVSAPSASIRVIAWVCR